VRKREWWKIGDWRVINSKKRGTVELRRITMRIMPWWWAIIATGTSILLGTAAWFVAWSIAKHDATLKIEAIKIGLSVTAGVGAASGLLLAFRRQMHNEYVAQDSAFDAAQRRVTELYAKSVEQLGHDKPAVRLGGLYALERLGQENPDHRQTVTNVICAYLRMPYKPISNSNHRGPRSTSRSPANIPSQDESYQELLIRTAAQQLLVRHLMDPEVFANPTLCWEGLRIDLRGAYLEDIAFTDCTLSVADFSHAIFVGDTWFDSTIFGDWCAFVGTQFDGKVRFGGGFAGPVDFSEANFNKAADFGEVEFDNDAIFDHVKFKADSKFIGAKFQGVTSFEQSNFDGAAKFTKAYFGGVTFKDVQFASPPDFTGATAKFRKVYPSEWPEGWTTVPSDDVKEILRLVPTASVKTPCEQQAAQTEPSGA
jgi:uncharacterized protein YjbI with pentapeptide repeats